MRVNPSNCTSEAMRNMLSCVALYDWNGELDQTRWLSLVLDFFQNHDIQPNIAVYGAGTKWSKPTSLRALQMRLQRPGLLESIELYSLPERYQTMMDATAGALIEDTGAAPQGKRSMVIAVPGSLDSMKMALYELCQLIAQECNVRYGIGYELPRVCGPIYYGLGIVQSSKDCHFEPAEEERIGMWFRERIGSKDAGPPNRHLSGQLRDVYHLNILSYSHLNFSINGNTLRQWILSDPRNGTLKDLDTNTSWWELSAASIGEVRKHLSQEGLIICDPRI